MTAETTSIEQPALPPEPAAARTERTFVLPWHRLVLAAILGLAAFLNFYQLDRVGYGNTYYAAAVRSMLQNWHNFFFNSFDPGGFVTIDKPPLGFWFQVASAKLFGYNGVSLLLPEALAGVLSVWLLYYLVARYFGKGAGLLAALFLAVTPVAVADNRNNIIDSVLVLFLLLGAWAVSRAAETGKLRWLLLCAVLVGLGFNVKMLEAYLVVPAFGLVYLLGAPLRWGRRIVHLVLATAVLLFVSLSWATAVDLTPASQRPWVDSTTTNSELDLAIGYNGLDRLLGRGGPGGFRDTTRRVAGDNPQTSVPGAGGRGTSSPQGGVPPQQPSFGNGPSVGGDPNAARAGNRAFRAPNGGGGGLFNNGPAGPLRLINADLGGQAGWLLPLALVGLVVAAVRRPRFSLDEQQQGFSGLAKATVRRLVSPLDRQQQGLVLWGAWLLTTAAFFSVAGFFHGYYLVTMAPAVAALAAIGLVRLWQLYQRRPAHAEWRGWVLPAALLVTAGVQAYILRDYADWNRWLTPIAVGGSLLASVVLVLARLRPSRNLRIWTPAAVAVATLALLATPTTWAANTVANGSGGMTPGAGPAPTRGNPFAGFPNQGSRGSTTDGRFGRYAVGGFGQGGGDGFRQAGGFPAGGPGGFGGGRDDGAGVNSQLLRYLEQHQGTTKYLVAMSNSMSAAPYIIQTGKPVMALGGFSGSDPILTLDELKTLVKNNTVRYFLGVGGFDRGGRGFGQEGSISSWVQQACTLVPSSAWQGSSAGTPTGSGFGTGGGPNGGGIPAGVGGAQGAGSARAAGGSPSGAGGFGGFARFFGGAQQLYDCAGAVQ